MIVYADDIVLYAIDKEDMRAYQKMIGTLDKIKIWCQANDLSISPEKCSAINFSRRRDPGQQLHLAGVDIPWSTLVKILGIWITRTLCFTPHFQSIKVKSLKSNNYLKFITCRSRDVTSYHMIRLVNSIIRSCIEYGAPSFSILLLRRTVVQNRNHAAKNQKIDFFLSD